MCGISQSAACGEAGTAPGQTTETAPVDADAGSGATQAGPAVRPENKSFRDWRAVCDNGNSCVAFTGGDNGWLRIAMPAGPDAVPSISVGMSIFAGADAPSGVAIEIDGRSYATTPGPQNSYRADLPAGRTRDVLTGLAAARELRLTGGSALSPAGISAALLWIDERQGRLDTTTALIRRGARPASAVSAAPALPQVMAAPAVDQGDLAGATDPGEQGADADLTLPAAIEAFAAVKQCREKTSDNAYFQKAVLAARLSATTELWGVPCEGWAYNANYELYITGPDGADPRLAEFPSWEARPRQEGDIVGEGLVNPVFDARTNSISHFPRGRGMGDCGIIQSWVWTGEAFVLTEEKSMGQCWGMIPDLWPTTWRTR